MIREASCTETGETIYHCHWNSAHTKTVTTRALGHNFVGGVCTRCGVSQITPGPTKKPTSKPTPHVHQWDEGVITVPAGYLETGIKTFTCTLCGETREEQVPLLTTMGGMDIMDYISLMGGGEDVLDVTDIPAPLRIVTQPEGGVISPGTQTHNEGGGIAITTTNRGSWSMFIEVEGGYAPYAYQ